MEYLSIMKKITALILSMAFVITCVSCKTDTGNSLVSISLTKDMRSWSNPGSQYKELLDEYGSYTCNGAVVVATDKDVVYLYGEDAVEKDGKTLVSQDTIFDLASMSKTFTAVLILKLQEEGKLNIEDTLDKYFPEYEAGKNIKIYNLLHMNSGISDYINNIDPFWNISGADAANKKISDILNIPDQSDWPGIRDKALLELLYGSGLKTSQIISLRVKDIDLQVSCIIMEDAGGGERIVPFGDRARKALLRYLSAMRSRFSGPDQILFVSREGEALTRQSIWKIVRKYARAAGIGKNVSPALLRSSLAAHLLEYGADPESVQDILGHKAAASTKRYDLTGKGRRRSPAGGSS